MSEPTPTPWQTATERRREEWWVETLDGDPIAKINSDKALEDAAFIVASCNSHAALLGACKDTLAILEAIGFGGSGNNARERRIEKQLRAAISLAEGRPA